jgi:hypothetical protein
VRQAEVNLPDSQSATGCCGGALRGRDVAERAMTVGSAAAATLRFQLELDFSFNAPASSAKAASARRWHQLCAKVLNGGFMAHPVSVISVALVALVLFGCDDTGKAIREEVKEIDKQEVKRDLKAAAATVGSAAEKAGEKVKEATPKLIEGAKDVAEETGKVIDKIDKKTAEEIRKD